MSNLAHSERPSDDLPKEAAAGGQAWSRFLVAIALLSGVMLACFVIGLAAQVFHFGGAVTRPLLYGGLIGIIPGAYLVVGAAVGDRAALLARRRLFGLVPIGIVPVVALFLAFGGTGVDLAWQAQRDRPSDVTAVGAWTTGEVVLRARPDQIVGYRITDGAVAWRWVPPGRDAVCAMSESVAAGVGLVGHGATGAPCATVTALDLTTGKPRWTQQVRAGSRSGDAAVAAALAIAGQTAVVQETGGWRGLNLADGKPKWSVSAAADCTPDSVAGGPGGVVTVTTCPKDAPVLRQYDAERGAELMRASLPMTTDTWDVAFLSTSPVTIWVDEEAERGTRGVLSFDKGGKVHANIPASGPESDIFLTLGSGEFTARPVRSAVVIDDMLVVVAVQPDDVRRRSRRNRTSYYAEDGRVDGYSLSDGTRRWTKKVAGEDLDGLAVDGKTVWTLHSDKLTQLDARTGRRITRVRAYDMEAPFVDFDLHANKGRFVIIAQDGTEDYPPVRVFD